jgi:membrane-associated protein
VLDFLSHHVSGSALTYLLIVGVCAGDTLFPPFPAALAGAVLGDNAAYGLGRGGLRRLAERLLGSERNQARLRWARTQLETSGAWIIIVARFIPGRRTATTYVAGTLELDWRRRFVPADASAGLLWSLYATALGYFGGAAFENNLWAPLLIATGP